MDEISAFLTQLREQPAEIRLCYSSLPTDAADTCRKLVIGDDRQEPHHPEDSAEPRTTTTTITPPTGSLSIAGIAPLVEIRG